MPEESLIQKVKKLLALAESSNEHEATLAAERAQELMLKYGIELAEVAAAKGEDIRVDKEIVAGKLDPWRRMLASHVAGSVGGQTVIDRDPGKWSGRIHFWGERGSAAAAAALYEYLEAQVTVISALAAGKRARGFKVGTQSAAESMRWRKSFCWGMTERVGERLEERKRAMEVESDAGTALVCLRTAVERVMNDAYEGGLRAEATRYNVDQDAHRSGEAAGDQVDLGDKRLRGGRGELTA